MTPSISVVIATYHNPPKYSDRRYVADCVASARAQTVGQSIVEVLVVDPSPDSQNKEIEYPGVDNYLTPQTNSKRPIDVDVCSAIAVGVSAADSVWLIPMNADDQLAPHFVENALAAIGKWQAQNMQRCGVVVVSQQPLSAAIERDNYIPYLAMFARWFWDEMGGLVDVLGEGGACRLADWDLWIRVWQRYGERAPVAYITDPSVIRLRDRPDSASKWSSDEFEALRARLWQARGIEP